MRVVMDLGLWYAPNDVEHHVFTIVDPDITNEHEALAIAVDWAMNAGRNLSSDRASSWPAHCRRPQNVTSFSFIDVQ